MPLLAFAALLGAAAPASAQVRVFVRDQGPGEMGRLVRAALARPHAVVVGDSTDLILSRDTSLARSLVVIGRDVRIAASVGGDVVVIGGDLYLRPGVHIAGDAIAIGGGVYNTMLGVVLGDRHAFRDETFVPTLLADGSYALDYRRLRARHFAAFSLPGIFGVGIPTYDRVNGLAIPWAPLIQLDSGRIALEPTATYRSHLGKLDPSLDASMSLGRASRLSAFAGRTTLTNDDWITGDFGNSLNSIWSGRDTRNWYRAGRAAAAFHRSYEGTYSRFTPYVGAQWERAWSTGIQAPPEHLAWSVLDRTDTLEGMARPNPAVAAGQIVSAVTGWEAQFESPSNELEVRTTGRLELAPSSVGDTRFGQLTLDGRLTFPLVRGVDFRFDWHGVATAGDAPPQRYAYLGGSGTLKTLDLLEQGGDQLLFVESRASMPLASLRLPLVGPPTLMVRHMMGSAGIGGLPGLTHNLGVRLTVAVVRAELVVDPIGGETDFGIAVSFTR